MAPHEPFNQLTPAQAERLAMLAEEAGEIVHIVGKILRHGLGNSHHDYGSVPNHELLRQEINDLNAVVSLIVDARDMAATFEDERITSRVSKLRFTHHQGDMG